MLRLQGSTFPGAQGHMPLDFSVGPRFFQQGAQNSIYIIQKSCFLQLIFIKKPFRAPSLESKCQTLGYFRPNIKDTKMFENHLIPVLLVFIINYTLKNIFQLFGLKLEMSNP